jgi:hypothetical protein
MKMTRTLAALGALGVLVAVPITADAKQGSNHSCSHPSVTRAFVVTGTLVSWDGTNLEITVKSANRHARNSGEIADQDASKKGVQVKGATYSITLASDTFKTSQSDYEAGEQPSAGDKVRIIGRIAITKSRCATDETLAERSAAPNVKRVKFIDAD